MVSDTRRVDLPLGYTRRPRDSFVFHALTHGLVSIPAVRVRPVIHDLAGLAGAAQRGTVLAARLSLATFGHLRHRFIALRAGATFTRDVGPLLVGRGQDVQLRVARVAVASQQDPGALLLRLLLPHPVRVVEVEDGDAIGALIAGECEAAVVPTRELDRHPDYTLPVLDDLGAAWDRQTGLPLPHDLVAIRRDLGPTLAMRLDRGVRDSVAYGRKNPEESAEHIRHQAGRDLEEADIASELETTVSELTEDLSGPGEDAVNELFARAGARGLIPRSERLLFVPTADV